MGVAEVSLAVNPTLRGSGGLYFASQLWPCLGGIPLPAHPLALGERKIPAWPLSDSIWLNLVLSQPCFDVGNAETVQ